MQTVRGWWLASPSEAPDWWPVMGGLHDDIAFFDLHLLHYHIDPRFLSAEQKATADLHHRRRQVFTPRSWHPAYQAVLTHFWIGENEPALVLDAEESRLIDRAGDWTVGTHSLKWGLDRIRTRTERRTCVGGLPAAPVDDEWRHEGFHTLRQHYADASGDFCPHRGYDLRNVPVDRSGYRQCPLHQLRVKANAGGGARGSARSRLGQPLKRDGKLPTGAGPQTERRHR